MTENPERRKHLDLDPDTVERDLVKLVLTIVELLRQLMERQALRRVDEGDLSEEQEERIGLTLMLLDDRMAELRDRYGLRPEDLNLDLGPLGPLLPRELVSRGSSLTACRSPPVVHHLYQRPRPPPVVVPRTRNPSSHRTMTTRATHQSTFNANPAPNRMSARSSTSRSGTIMCTSCRTGFP